MTTAISQLLRLVSEVSKRRLPITCDSELTMKVACQTSTVLRKKPVNSAGQPKVTVTAKPSSTGGQYQLRLSHWISGNFAKSLTRS